MDITRKTTFALLTITYFLYNSTCSGVSEDAVSLLMKAYQNSGSNPEKIRSGHAVFEVQTEHRSSPEHNKILDQLRKQQEEWLKKTFEHNPEQL